MTNNFTSESKKSLPQKKKPHASGTTSLLKKLDQYEKVENRDLKKAKAAEIQADLVKEKKKMEAMAHLLLGERVNMVAQVIGVDLQTIRKFFEDPEFVRELRMRRDWELQAIETKVINASDCALDTLMKECRESVEAKDRIKAAEILLTRAFDLRPEATRKALVEVNTHQHLDLSGLAADELHKLLGRAKTIEAEMEEENVD